MWNFQVAGPARRRHDRLLRRQPDLSDAGCVVGHRRRVGATVLGTSPGYVLGCIKAGAVPRDEHDLSALRTVGITGSSLPPSSSLWLRDNVGEHVQVASISGGTDVVSAFIGGVPHRPGVAGGVVRPVPRCRAGRLGRVRQAGARRGRRAGHHQADAVDAGRLLERPRRIALSRVPISTMFPGVWRHGDWITITDRGSSWCTAGPTPP